MQPLRCQHVRHDQVVQRLQRHGTGAHLAGQPRPEPALVIGLVSLDRVTLVIELLSEKVGEVAWDLPWSVALICMCCLPLADEWKRRNAPSRRTRSAAPLQVRLFCRRAGAGVEPRLGYGLKAGAARRQAGRPSGAAEARIGNAVAGSGAAAEKGAAVPLSEFETVLSPGGGGKDSDTSPTSLTQQMPRSTSSPNRLTVAALPHLVRFVRTGRNTCRGRGGVAAGRKHSQRRVRKSDSPP